jgi:hypothetical protein
VCAQNRFTSLHKSDLVLIGTSAKIAASEFDGIEDVKSWT